MKIENSSQYSNYINVHTHGAAGDGKQKDTEFIQAAIDKCGNLGGGTVVFPAGTYLTGTLILKDNVHILLDSGAVVLGSPDDNDFLPDEELGYETYGDHSNSYHQPSIFYCNEVSNISFSGRGKIHSNRNKRGHIKTLSITYSDNISIKGITIENAMDYAISFIDCEYINIDNVTILNAFADGIDLDNCRCVRISNSHIDSWDDSICLKSSLATGSVSIVNNIVVTNCTISSTCNCFKLGTETSGPFNNITFSNSVFFSKPFARRARSGIAIESVDGSDIDGLSISNITMENVLCPIFIRLGNRGRGMKTLKPGSIKNINMSNIVVRKCSKPIIISGIPEYYVQNISLSNITINYLFESEIEKLNLKNYNIIEAETEYPDPTMFEDLPCWALYCRHLKNLNMNNMNFHLLDPEIKSTAVFDDCSMLNCQNFNTYAEPELFSLCDQNQRNKIPDIFIREVFGSTFDNWVLNHTNSGSIRISGEPTKDLRFRQVQDLKKWMDAEFIGVEEIDKLIKTRNIRFGDIHKLKCNQGPKEK